MRRSLLGLVVCLGVAGLATEAKAQVPFTNINDPFFAYYSFSLPRQQAQALQSGPETTIAAITANRQAYAATNRNEAFDTNSPGLDNESGEFAPNSGFGRGASGSRASRIGGNLNGLGPTAYFNNPATRKFHPTIRPGQTKNNNLSVIKSRSFSGGGIGGVGLPGPR